MKIFGKDGQIGIVNLLRWIDCALEEEELSEYCHVPDWPIHLKHTELPSRNIDDLVIHSGLDEQYRHESISGGTALPSSQIAHPDFLGWYASYRKFSKWGIYIRQDKLLDAAIAMFAGLQADGLPTKIDDKIERICRLVIEHERFHFIADCMVSQIELLSLSRDYTSARSLYLNKSVPHLVEEKMANAFALRRLKALYGPTTYDAAATYIAANGLPGYKDGSLAVEDENYNSGLRDLGISFFGDTIEDGTYTSSLYHQIIGPHINWPALFPNDQDLISDIPIYFVSEKNNDEEKKICFITAIDVIEESQKFLKSMRKLKSPWLEKAWIKVKAQLKAGQLNQCRFKKWSGDLFSVRVGGNKGPAFRAHLKLVTGHSTTLIVEDIGSHKAMGHD
ncbi:hypothetical protein N9R01_00685 [Porticoccaceae bacterium]|nr:hypothetical protein [Porticoccaceae bacterium]